jgi:uncharacterized membrane protein YcjF (UPF0283 family)
MKLVKPGILIIGAIVFAVGLIRSGLSVGNVMAALGLLIFSLGASSYFIAWPVSKYGQQHWRFNTDFVWLLIYVGVSVICIGWLALLSRLL